MGKSISIAVPIHDMKDRDFFLDRLITSVREQTYTDWELVITKDGEMAENTNSAIEKSTGDLIKILYMDDFLAHKDALKDIVEAFTDDVNWLSTGCTHTHGKDRFNEHLPTWNDNIHTTNTIGSPSVVTIRNKDILFDEKLSWMLDADWYKRLYEKHGLPKFLNSTNVVIGVGEHQMTNILSEERKLKEVNYVTKKYDQ